MRILDTAQHFIYHTKRSRLIASVLFVSFLKTGIWYMPNIDMWRRLAMDPFRNPFSDPTAHYIVWNWLRESKQAKSIERYN